MKSRSVKKQVIAAIALAMLSCSLMVKPLQADELTSTVVENPYNRLAAQLDSKGRDLSRREQALDALEAKLEKSYYQVFALVGFLFLLIVANFILDFRRRRSLLNKQ